MEEKDVYIGLGSNLGDRALNLQVAIDKIREITEIRIKTVSSVYLTEPWGNKNQDDFFNQVIRIETHLGALELLKKLQQIEIKMGRQRRETWGPRIIDIDILLYGDEIVDLPELIIPHPYMQQRLFVLIPLEEVNSEIVFPDSGMRIREVLIRALGREGNKGIKRIK